MEEMIADLKKMFESDGFHIPNEEELQEVKRMFQEKDVTIIEKVMKDKLNNWKEVSLHCGITGSLGSGKSSFINTIRNLETSDTRAAFVGTFETTKEPTPYQDPNNPNVVYWKLPDVGTENFPMDETYLEQIEFTKYDFFVIISCTTFTANDVWLAKQIRDAGKRFYFVRTKLDDDMCNQRRKYRREYTYNEKNVRNKIQEDLVEGLEKQGIMDPKVYLVSNPDPEITDFPDLLIEVSNSLPLHKRKAMTLSIHAFSKKIILEKKKFLQTRINYLSVLSALGSAVPVPFVSMAVDFSIILNEIDNYRKQFGLEDEDLKKKNITDDKIEFIRRISTKEALVKRFATYAKSTVAEEIGRYVPIFGTLIASSASFYTTYSMLNLLLNKMTDISIEIMKKRFDDMVKDMEMD